jgi:hypothetical protein
MRIMGINGRIILKWILEKQWIYWIQLARQVPTINFREHNDKSFVPIKRRNILTVQVTITVLCSTPYIMHEAHTTNHMEV